MRGVNKAIILGNIGKDPETRYMPSGGAVTSFSVATSESWKDKQTGENQERTEWHNITAFGKLAEICSQYLKKGSKVYIEGKIQTDKWQDKSGNDRYTTKIIANNLQMLGDREPAPQQNYQQEQPTSQHQGQAAPQGQMQSNPTSTYSQQQPEDDFSDDIPF